MSNIGVLTTQNVFLKHKVANVGERILATIIDSIIISSYTYFMYFISQYGPSHYSSEVFLHITISVIGLYHPVSEIFMNGQSLGKKAMGLQVIKIDGSQPTIANFIVRWLFRLADVTLSSGILAIIVISANGKGQRVGDIVAKTMVVNIRKKESVLNTIHETLSEDYKIIYSSVDLLNDTDIATVKEVLKLYKKDMSNLKNSQLIKKTAQAIETKINTKAKESPNEFLNTIVKDYNFIHRY